MKEIKLTQGKVALVDDEYFEMVNQYHWYYTYRNCNEYAVASIKVNGVRKMIKMHRLILGLTDPKILVDHKNHNGLHNYRSNLRTCTYSENLRNRTSRENSTSKHLGVSWKTAKKRWYAGIRYNGKHIYLGMSKSETAAACMYNEGAKKYFGEFANLNVI